MKRGFVGVGSWKCPPNRRWTLAVKRRVDQAFESNRVNRFNLCVGQGFCRRRKFRHDGSGRRQFSVDAYRPRTRGSCAQCGALLCALDRADPVRQSDAGPALGSDWLRRPRASFVLRPCRRRRNCAADMARPQAPARLSIETVSPFGAVKHKRGGREPLRGSNDCRKTTAPRPSSASTRRGFLPVRLPASRPL